MTAANGHPWRRQPQVQDGVALTQFAQDDVMASEASIVRVTDLLTGRKEKGKVHM